MIKVNAPPHLFPNKATPNSAGFDLRLPEDIILHPNKPTKIDMRVALEMPADTYAQLKIRSSLGLRGIIMLSEVIDSDYRRNIFLSLMNLTLSDVKLEKMERVAQILFKENLQAELIAGVVSPTPRGGFGSTGKF